jgi:endonuclease-3 related protein
MMPLQPIKNTSRNHLEVLLDRIYQRTIAVAGPQHWWPCDRDSPDNGRGEIIIGSVLTQNTSWRNVVQSLATLRRGNLCSLVRLAVATPDQIAEHIRSSGYYNLKARRLHAVACFFAPGGRERFDELDTWDLPKLRSELLNVYGVGDETADSILLYAMNRRVFVIDAYTLRIGSRHGLFSDKTSYEEAQALITGKMRRDTGYYNEYHALLVWIGNRYCKPRPRCAACPLSRRDCCSGRKVWEEIRRIRSS